ncbi:LPS-assembly lipoprotein [Marinobacter daqiaonensis]|uniref:LPS-assembly lipoprotein LptE n=1 Tax=Marinobacter daqiaonensis TaxID=650891 RepID=A0A1I6HCS4_9GAMM|nr:LPS assembly lipoprotein LptE [Marinobacter daqiaonensis]SFR52253.1 LPS-assembly lipoprotein [Marinobacter daqiaonensis]
MTRYARNLSLIVLAVALGGCGFQLRGSSPVPEALQPLWVDCHDSVPFPLCQAVRAQVGAVAESRQDASYALSLGDFRQRQRTSAITLQGEAAEYDLRQTVTIVLLTRDGNPLLEETEVGASQAYRFDETSVLAKRRERQEIERQLYDNLARQISFRLSPFDQGRIDRTLEAGGEQPPGDSRP